MGRPKITLPLPGGDVLGVRVFQALSSVCKRIVLLGQSPELPPELINLDALPDLRPGMGPLAGWESLLASGLDSEYLIIPCDLPDVTPELLRLLTNARPGLVSVFQGPGADFIEPMPARVSADALGVVREALDANRPGVQKVIQKLSPVIVELPRERAGELRNLNRPGDMIGS